jgi:hypothetical protein
MTLVMRQTPPPRVFTFLAPYFYLLFATGLIACVDGVKSMLKLRGPALVPYAAPLLALLVLVRGSAYVASGRIFEHTETGACRAARPAVAWLAEHAPDADRVLAPLGCDVPTLYYLVRSSLPIEWMGEPKPGERLYLLTPRHRPEEVSSDPLLAPLSRVLQPADWRHVTDVGAASLWKSVMR